RIQSLCDWAHASGLLTHMDGARLFNASIATGISLADFSAPFDSISVCFSKGLGAPVGSCLVGSRDFINRARRARKLFGGGMRQVGILAAGALYALENQMDRLFEDHEHARMLAKAISECHALQLADPFPDTNIVIFHIASDWGTAQQLADKLKEQGILSFPFGPQSVRLVTHLDVSREQIERSCNVLRGIAC
ncbi:MAG: beta-eliminating lyase-related protein, partial [Pirellula sp.]